jgi:aspartate/methionine/tyrosine aminotransferase
VTAIPVTAFYAPRVPPHYAPGVPPHDAGPDAPNHYARFAFCKNEAVLREALSRIEGWMAGRAATQRAAAG